MVDNMFLVALVPIVGVFLLGLAVGWLMAKGRKRDALVAFFVGGFFLFSVYTGMLTPAFDIKNEIH